MKPIHIVIRGQEGDALTRLVRAALHAHAALRGLAIDIDVSPAATWQQARQRDRGSRVVFVSDEDASRPRSDQGGDGLVTTTRADALRHTGALLERVVPSSASSPPPDPARNTAQSPAPGGTKPTAPVATARKSLVAVTSCPTGVAHTFMAAEALRRGAAALGHDIKVETRGSVGAKNELTAEDIAGADAVVVAADAHVDLARFAGKRMLETGTKAAIHDARSVLQEALQLPAPEVNASPATPAARQGKSRSSVYKHLMTGVSHMLPLIVAGGLAIAIAFAVGGLNAGEEPGTLGHALLRIGQDAAFVLFIPVFAAFIAFSIADRPGLAPGFIGGMLAATAGAGFLGGIVVGFLAGYVTKWLNDAIKLPEAMQGLKPVLLLPLLSSLIVGLSMIYVIGPPVKIVLDATTAWLSGMQTHSALVLGLLLGAMMAVDMGGPINKASYTFAVGMLASGVTAPMAAAMAAGMTPPLGVSFATLLFPKRFNSEERRAGKAAGILGLSFITEGAIPFAAADPLRVIPALVAGSAVTGALSMVLGCELVVPHGGVFVLVIPNAMNHPLLYLASILAGAVVTATALFFLKRPTPPTMSGHERDGEEQDVVASGQLAEESAR